MTEGKREDSTLLPLPLNKFNKKYISGGLWGKTELSEIKLKISEMAKLSKLVELPKFWSKFKLGKSVVERKK